MNIAVILRQVPDTEANVVVDPSDTAKIVEDDIKFILNPFDEYAVEEALQISDQTDQEVIGVCIGPQQAETAIRSAMAMGIDRAVFISETEAVETDTITQAKILSAVIKTLDVSLVLCSKEWIDVQDDAMAAAIAEFLDLPHISNAGKVSVEQDKITVSREMDGGTLKIESSLPVVISCSKDLNEPRYPTLIAIKRAKRKEIKQMSLAELNIRLDSPRSRILTLQSPPERAAGKRVSGEPQDVAKQAVTWLTDEARIF